MSEVACPQCSTAFHIDMAAAVGNKQRFSYRVYPDDSRMMQAKVIGGQLVAADDLMRACAREDGGKVRTYIDRIETHGDGSFEFFLIVLPVVAWDEKKGRFVRNGEDGRRDSDGSGEAGETGTGSTEGDSAAPKGIAHD